MKNKADSIWYDNPSILTKHLTEFFPSHDMTHNERLNSFVRLSFYISIVLSFYHKKQIYMYIFIGAMILTLYIGKNSIENFTEINKKKCRVPTIDNPFMNVTMEDYLNTDTNGNIIDPGIVCEDLSYYKKDIDEKFNNNLYNDVDDLFGKNNSQRQFYTARTELIPDIDGNFKNWLYKPRDDSLIKANNMPFDLQRSRSNISYNPYENPTTLKQ